MAHDLQVGFDMQSDIELLHRLQEKYYLSTACAAGDHRQCRNVDKYRTMVCVCTECAHGNTQLPPGLSCGPLIRSGLELDDWERSAYSFWEDSEVGVRTDVTGAVIRTLANRFPEFPSTRLAEAGHRIGLSVGLVVAPRML